MTDVRAAALLTPPADPSHAPASGRARLRFVNGALRALWRGGLADEPSLVPAALIAAACARTGLDDFGVGDHWREGLKRLAGAIQAEAQLTPLGRTIAHGQLVGHLAARLRAVRLWRAHPEIARIPVTAPIVVLGQMRSGTTRVQRLLACDPELAHTRFFESWNPVPGRRFDDRRLRGMIGLTVAHLLNPGFKAIHPTTTGAPDEEIGLQSFSFFGSAFEAQWRVPSYVAWVEGVDARPFYAEFRLLLQTLAFLRGDDGARPTVLKVPQFTQDLPALLDAFPGARLLRLTRDPGPLVASSASLVRNQMAVQSDAVDPRWIGREWRRKIALREARMTAALTVPHHELAFAAMNRDAIGEMRKVYDFLGRPLTADVEARMRTYLAQSGGRKLDRHRYDPAEFGLD
jgi:hypothetical protein